MLNYAIYCGEASECYTNDIQCLYTVVNNIQNLKQERSMESYLGHVQALMQELETLMLFVNTRTDIEGEILHGCSF